MVHVQTGSGYRRKITEGVAGRLARLLAGCALLVAAPAAAQNFYQGKTITLIVGGAAGVSYDTYARGFARHFPTHVPGNPGIIVQNMPGAGSMKAAEYMATQAPKDGTTIAMLFPGALIEPLMDPGKFRYDPNKFEYLGTIDQDARSCITRVDSKVKTFEDALKHSVVMVGTQPGSSTVDYPNMLNALVGTRFKVVSGFKGATEAMLAVERGEADGICTSLNGFLAFKPEWLDPAHANMFIQIGLEPHPELTKRNVPNIWPYVPAENKAALELIALTQVFSRPVSLPPGVPAAQLETLRAAFVKTMADPAFAKELANLKVDMNPLSGEKVAELIRKMYEAPKDVIDRMTRAFKPERS